MESIHNRKRPIDFPVTCLNHWRNNKNNDSILFIEGVVYVDEEKRKKKWLEKGGTKERLASNELSSAEIKEGLSLKGIPVMLRHQQRIGYVFDDAYDKIPWLDESVSGIYIYAAIPISAPWLESRMHLATQVLMCNADMCDLSLSIKACFFPGGIIEHDKVRHTYKEVGVLPEKGGNRGDDCCVTKALLITYNGNIIQSF